MTEARPVALITGANGQLGRELQRSAPTFCDCRALSRAELDTADADAVAATLATLRPALVINAAAYTAVDRAETEPDQARLLCHDLGESFLGSGQALRYGN